MTRWDELLVTWKSAFTCRIPLVHTGCVKTWRDEHRSLSFGETPKERWRSHLCAGPSHQTSRNASILLPHVRFGDGNNIITHCSTMYIYCARMLSLPDRLAASGFASAIPFHAHTLCWGYPYIYICMSLRSLMMLLATGAAVYTRQPVKQYKRTGIHRDDRNPALLFKVFPDGSPCRMHVFRRIR